MISTQQVTHETKQSISFYDETDKCFKIPVTVFATNRGGRMYSYTYQSKTKPTFNYIRKCVMNAHSRLDYLQKIHILFETSKKWRVK